MNNLHRKQIPSKKAAITVNTQSKQTYVKVVKKNKEKPNAQIVDKSSNQTSQVKLDHRLFLRL